MAELDPDFDADWNFDDYMGHWAALTTALALKDYDAFHGQALPWGEELLDAIELPAGEARRRVASLLNRLMMMGALFSARSVAEAALARGVTVQDVMLEISTMTEWD